MAKHNLRIATWNCNGALRKKWSRLAELGADIYIVQECEDPVQTKDRAYQAWAGTHVWVGPTMHKGIGVFAKAALSLRPVAVHMAPLELFLPCLVDDSWPLLAVWTKQANSPNFAYIGQLWKFLQQHKNFLQHPEAMLIGDLNSNAIWDEWDRWWNHSDVVRELAAIGLQSCYHQHFVEPHGGETKPTFFLHRKVEKAYHIDYGFAGPSWAIKTVDVGSAADWLAHSDHAPVVFDLVRSA